MTSLTSAASHGAHSDEQGSSSRHPGLNLHQHDPEAHDAAEELLFGFWIFLMSDLVIFSMLFATYGTMLNSLAGGPGPHQLFDLGSTAIETVVLLSSSLSFGMATLAMKYDASARKTGLWIFVTLLLGLVFLGFEIHDFSGMISKGGFPSRSGYLSSFFALVGTHGLHVTVGCIWLVVMLVQLRVFGLDSCVKTRILRLGLFWHFLDIIWVGIFSVVYLLELAP